MHEPIPPTIAANTRPGNVTLIHKETTQKATAHPANIRHILIRGALIVAVLETLSWHCQINDLWVIGAELLQSKRLDFAFTGSQKRQGADSINTCWSAIDLI
jgi:hypothetical protein